jgi:hypothetical protein
MHARICWPAPSAPGRAVGSLTAATDTNEARGAMSERRVIGPVFFVVPSFFLLNGLTWVRQACRVGNFFHLDQQCAHLRRHRHRHPNPILHHLYLPPCLFTFLKRETADCTRASPKVAIAKPLASATLNSSLTIVTATRQPRLARLFPLVT